MTKDEALKMAIEILDLDVDCVSESKWINALNACKEALEQPAWQGLTDDEIKDILDCGRGGLVDIKKAEQILKEKNHVGGF